MTISPTQLAYLFVAKFNDGTSVVQTAEDVSQEEAGKNAFYDVLKKGLEYVHTFTLRSEGQRISLDLSDGSFRVFDGQPVYLHDPEFTGPFKLVFHLRRRVMVTLGPGDIVANDTMYYLGWEANHELGKLYKGIWVR